MGDGFARVGQHFAPVISSQALGHVSHSTHPNDLVMTDAVDNRKYLQLHLCFAIKLKKMHSKNPTSAYVIVKGMGKLL